MIEVIKLGADWCQPCKTYDPTFDAIAEKHQTGNTGVVFKKLDIEQPENLELVQQYSVRSIPTTVFVVNGEVKEKKIGVLTESAIEEIINIIRG
jgi:thioredoxin 1